MARWFTCNVLQAGAGGRLLWQFSGGKFNLLHEQAQAPGEPLPPKLINKDWQTLLQPRLNIAWLPAENVFLRAVQLPPAEGAELRAMVELQLEKLSPLPVAQILWSYEVLPKSADMQTVIVVIVARDHVEEFLGKLEGDGYLADRLELPFLDQLQAAEAKEDGMWLYPGVGGTHSCLVAWWCGGVLQNLSLINLPPNETRGTVLQNQLAQMIWAGELEGWLTGTPPFHLVAEGAEAEEWKALFGPEQEPQVTPAATARELAARTARRVAANSLHTNLLPREFAARYKQQFVDRLWMRSLGALVVVYVAAVLVYFGLVQYATWQYGRVQDEVDRLGPGYTNTLQLKEKVKVLQDQLELQFAALECYKAVAEKLPEGLTLDTLNFERGRKLTVIGVSGEDVARIHAFNDSLRSATDKGGQQPLFSKINPPIINPKGPNAYGWSFACELKRTDTE
jgi:hypothetical protein